MLPPLVAVLLALPALWIRFVWDDFDLVQRASHLTLQALLPDSSVVFYRPVSRALFFWPVAQLGPHGWIGAHLLGLGLLVAVVALTQRLAARLYGAGAGFYAGLLFASMGALPMLVGWASAAQDLLAILFVLLALHAQLSGRWPLAALFTACGILSKETAVVLAPLIASARWFSGMKPFYLRRSLLAHGLLLSGWLAVHPGMRLLLSRGFATGKAGYIGLSASGPWKSIGDSAVSMLNVPYPGAGIEWPAWATLSWIGVMGLMVVAWQFRVPPKPEKQNPAAARSNRRKLAFSALLAILPLASTALLVRGWNPYYVCFSGPGMALLLAPFVARAALPTALVSMAAFATLGVLSRGSLVAPSLTVERNLRQQSQALERVEEGLKRAIPAPDPNSALYIGCDATQQSTVPQHLFRFQAPRTWYGIPSLEIRDPDQRVAGAGAEYLVWISKSLQVVRLDAAGAGGSIVPVGEDPSGPQRVIRRYAFGLAMAGEHQRAATTVLGAPGPADYPEDFNRRIAGAILEKGGLRAEGLALRRDLKTLKGDAGATLAIAALLELPVRGGEYAPYVLDAFNVPLDDEQLIRGLMRWFAGRNYLSMASSIGAVLLRIRPGDEEALAVEREYKSRPERDRIVTPTEGVGRPG